MDWKDHFTICFGIKRKGTFHTNFNVTEQIAIFSTETNQFYRSAYQNISPLTHRDLNIHNIQSALERYILEYQLGV